MLTLLLLALSYFSVISLVQIIFGDYGVAGEFWSTYSVLKYIGYSMIMTHITITCMSLSFHRAHTHRGVKFNAILDFFMQTWLWLITGMSKQDWVSVHLYHHAHSDGDKDPHSPVKKGFWRIFLFGVYDYVKAKSDEPVVRIRKRLPTNAYERFYDSNPLLGPLVLTSFNLIVFGAFHGTILSLLNFTVSPLFAVGGVNAVAHKWGYRNHQSGDNSRNIGFLFILNWMICGELDHNNHHAHQKSCSFRHRWFEFDIGYVYIKLLSYVRLAKIKVVYKPENLKDKIKQQMVEFLENEKISQKLEELANEINASYEELKEQIIARINGEVKKLEPALENLIREIKLMLRENTRFQLA